MIPLYKPYIKSNEIEAVSRVLKSGKLSRGREIEKFEKSFASYTRKKYAVAVNSGTSGLHLAVRAMGWKQGDEVITTAFSYIASANSLLFEGVTPVFVDIDPITLNIDVDQIEQKITKKTKGILLVHILGLPVNIEKIAALKKKYNLGIIEDACEALGRPGNDFPVSLVGDISIYGFHENKQLTTGGEGGMVTTNNHSLAEKCKSMRDQGRSSKRDWIKHVSLGFNYRMTEMQAAFGNAQLKNIDKILRRRNEIANKYSSFLGDIKGLIVPTDTLLGKRSWFLYFILFENPKDRDSIHNALSKAGVCSSCNYFPVIYDFPMYSKCKNLTCKNSEYVSKRLLALPTFYDITDDQIKFISNIIKKTLR